MSDVHAASRLDTIDGLRGLAALMVVASHASAGGMNLIPGLSLEGIGKYGVFLFFVISAYLLTAQWLRAREPHQGRFLLRYLVRRVARIYPLYAVVLLLGWALTPPGLGIALDGPAVLRHLALQEGRGVYWSVPVEFLYYLVIPPLAWWLLAPLPRMLRGVAVLGALAVVMLFFPSSEAPLNSIELAYYAPIFVCGSLCAWYLHQSDASRSAPAVGIAAWGTDVLLWMALLATIPALFIALGWGGELTALHRTFLPWGIAWSLVVIGVRTGRLPLTSMLMRWRGLGLCGQWCFGLYLLHMPVLLAVRRLPLVPAEIKAWIALGLAAVVASLAYRYIERPFIERASRWS